MKKAYVLIFVKGQPVSSSSGAAVGGMAGPLASSSTSTANAGIPGLTAFQTLVYSIIQVLNHRVWF